MPASRATFAASPLSGPFGAIYEREKNMSVIRTVSRGPRRYRTLQHAVRSAIELLERRALLSAVSWTGGGDGVHWGDANNWSTHALPGTSDDVTINAVPATVVQVNTGTDSVNSLTSSNQILLKGGTLTLAAASQVTQLNFSSGTLSGAGNLTVTGTLNWSGGTMTGTGTTIVPSAGSLTVPSGDVAIQRIVEIDGTASYTGGRLRFLNGTLNINGTFTAAPATGQTLDSFGDGGSNAINIGSTGSLINNGPGTTQFRTNVSGIAVNNSGSVSVQQGTLNLSSGGTQTGSFSIAAATTLGLAGTHAFSASATFAGSGTINVANGTSTFAGAVNFPGTLQIGNPGEADLNAASTFSSLKLTAGGTLGGSGTITFTGASTWTGGTMSGTGTTLFPAGATLSIPSGDCGVDRVVRVDGSATYTGGRLRFFNGTLNINGTFTATAPTGQTLDSFGDGGTNALNVSSGGSLINNGPGITQFRANISDIAVNNSGSVSVQQGTLNLSSGGTHTGSFAVAPAATLGLAGTHAFSAASTFSGGGTINVANGTSTFAGLLNFAAGSLQLNNPGMAVIQGAGTSTLSSLAIASGAHLDLRTSSLRISYGAGPDPVASVRTALQHGQLLGTGSPALGYGDSADGVVAGLPANTLLIKPAYPGDLNLDGTVNFADLLRLAQHYGGTNDYWDQGDLNYDGIVAFADLLALAQNYGRTLATAAISGNAAPAFAPVTQPPVVLSESTLVTSGRRRRTGAVLKS